jgi:hypothetical protein
VATNRSNVQLEGHAAYGVERTAAAVRVAVVVASTPILGCDPAIFRIRL